MATVNWSHVFVFVYISTHDYMTCFFFLMIRRPPRSTLDRSSAASDVYKRQVMVHALHADEHNEEFETAKKYYDTKKGEYEKKLKEVHDLLSLIHISEPTRPY